MTKLLAAVAGIGVAAAVVLSIIAVESGMHAHPFLRVWNLLGLVILLAAVALIVPFLGYGADSDNPLLCGLVASVTTLPINIALIATAGAYVVPFELIHWKIVHRLAMLIGALLALALWFAWAWINGRKATARDRNTAAFGLLTARCSAIERAYDAAPNPLRMTDDQLDAWTEVRSNLDSVQTDCGIPGEPQVAPVHQIHLGRGPIGLRWVQAAGYITAWKRLHSAEEALVIVQPESALYSGMVRDGLRLTGSRIGNRNELISNITRGAAASPFQSNTPPTPTGDAAEPATTPFWARSLLRQVRQTVNEYRDACWDTLVRRRCRAIPNLLLLQVMTWTILGVLLITEAPRHSIEAALVFALVGGLGAALSFPRRTGKGMDAIEDYGLSSILTGQALWFAAMVAVAAVVVTGSIVVPGLTVNLAGHGSAVSRTFDDIFTLKRFPGGILVAAATGWLAGTWLSRTTNRGVAGIKQDILASEPYGSVAR